MAIRTISMNFPDGKEDELIQEFALSQGWTLEEYGPIGPFIRSVFAKVFRDGIKTYREELIRKQALQIEEEEIA